MMGAGQHVVVRTLATDMMGPLRLRALQAQLDPQEHARANRFAKKQDRRDWIAARGYLRELLTQHLPRPPEHISFATDPRGKPQVVLNGAPAHGIDINVTHTAGLVACAIGFGVTVGVDAEKIDDRSHDDLARDVLTQNEVQWLAARPPADSRADFLRLWTLKEAVAKAEGSGLSLDFASFSVLPDPPRLMDTAEQLGARAGWRLAQWRPTERHVVALAYRRQAESPCSLDMSEGE